MCWPCVFAFGDHCRFYLDSSTVHANIETMSAILEVYNSKKQTIKHLAIYFTFKSEMKGVHPFFQKLIREILEVSFSVHIIFSYENEGKFSRNAAEFLEGLFELVGSGKTNVKDFEFRECNRNYLEEGSPILDSLEARIVGMVADSRSSILWLVLEGFLPNRKKLELKIAKSALHHECCLKSLEVFHVENFVENEEDPTSCLVNASVQTREKRKTAVLVCCVLRACDGAPHFMDVMLQVAAFVGVLQ